MYNLQIKTKEKNYDYLNQLQNDADTQPIKKQKSRQKKSDNITVSQVSSILSATEDAVLHIKAYCRQRL